MSNLSKYFDQTWIDAIGEERLLSTLKQVNRQLSVERENYEVLPSVGNELTFKAFRLTPLDKVKVVIVGMDIYHDGSYNGVAFGNGFPEDPPRKVSPSLRNILKELNNTHGSMPSPDLYSWAEQGVLLINTGHTVRRGSPGSHISLWSDFTTNVFRALSSRDDIVWMLWGGEAKKYQEYVSNKTHKIIVTGHPSPLNRTNPFVGSNCFIECDLLLKDDKITWC